LILLLSTLLNFLIYKYLNFQNLGFNCYLKKSETSQSRQEYSNKNHFQDQFELDLILNVPYQKDMMQIQFPGLSANQFYKLIKQMGQIKQV
jgi:hypothetical protein